jgi:hypothetical protein
MIISGPKIDPPVAYSKFLIMTKAGMGSLLGKYPMGPQREASLKSLRLNFSRIKQFSKWKFLRSLGPRNSLQKFTLPGSGSQTLNSKNQGSETKRTAIINLAVC